MLTTLHDVQHASYTIFITLPYAIPSNMEAPLDALVKMQHDIAICHGHVVEGLLGRHLVDPVKAVVTELILKQGYECVVSVVDRDLPIPPFPTVGAPPLGSVHIHW